MDNLGEAQAVHTGTHPASEPIGRSPAVLTTLPRILDLLDSTGEGIKATYFAETWSLKIYLAAAAELTRRGHELAWHGYQHESWRTLDASQERALFARSFAEAPGAGVAYEGFRPPGGATPDGARTRRLLAEHGVRYISPEADDEGAGARFDPATAVVTLPFAWEAVDAFWYMDKFAALRKAHGVDVGEAGPEEQFRAYLYRRVEEAKKEEAGGFVCVLFHPFLQVSEERLVVLAEVLARIACDQELWVVPCRDVARWVAAHPGWFGAGEQDQEGDGASSS